MSKSLLRKILVFVLIAAAIAVASYLNIRPGQDKTATKSLSDTISSNSPNIKGADVVIDNVTYERLSSSGEPLGPFVKLTVKLKNTGNEPFQEILFLANTKSKKDLDDNLYTEIAAFNFKNEPLKVANSYDATVVLGQARDIPTVRFIVFSAAEAGTEFITDVDKALDDKEFLQRLLEDEGKSYEITLDKEKL